ncbi:cytochrome C oxidase subunit IV family protein [Saccharicrinis fermentans]|uniref:cytochrome C oxidase subunit IV family protein n=1 Tax=Saccharicrinis fermentans TaxID=982 RepID=UPI0009DECABE
MPIHTSYSTCTHRNNSWGSYVEFGQLTIFVTLLLASIKSTLVLIYFMHLKFDNRIIQIIVPTIFILVTLVLIVTFLDYNFR